MYTESYKIIMKEIEDINKWTDIMFIDLKYPYHPKVVYGVNAIRIKISLVLFLKQPKWEAKFLHNVKI